MTGSPRFVPLSWEAHGGIVRFGNEHRRRGFTPAGPASAAGAVDCLQIDVTRCGGYASGLRVSVTE
jgi:hypothetical protein